VLLNLLSNAVKFTTEGYVRLNINVTDTIICFTVSDTGMGIREEDIPKLFDAFEQVDKVKNRGKRGTGLGLSITKGIVEMMGGRLKVESVYGQGTSFHAEIPMVSGDEELINKADFDEIAICAPDAKILVVDDNVINLNVATGLLQLCQITVETATSGKDAIKLVKQNQYDIVFMDYRMPEMNGVEAAKIIRSLGITVPIIALTASAITGAREMMLENGMVDFLTKPIIRSELKSILKKWIPAEKLLDAPPVARIIEITENEEEKEFWEKVRQIKEISLATGLDRIQGQRNVYKRMLRLMVDDINKSDKNLNKFLEEEDMRNFQVEVHGIKGSLASIGAMDLSEKARVIEAASDKDNISFCVSNLPLFLNELNNLNLKLQDIFSITQQNNVPIEILPELPIILNRLEEAFTEIDFDRIDEELENLDELNLSNALKFKIEHIKDEVIVMDYEAAAEHIAELLKPQEIYEGEQA
jgi:CheY-like chemotaxis protein/HPt (histidine-containing phosphotransfer) domain-containing protein